MDDVDDDELTFDLEVDFFLEEEIDFGIVAVSAGFPEGRDHGWGQKKERPRGWQLNLSVSILPVFGLTPDSG